MESTRINQETRHNIKSVTMSSDFCQNIANQLAEFKKRFDQSLLGIDRFNTEKQRDFARMKEAGDWATGNRICTALKETLKEAFLHTKESYDILVDISKFQENARQEHQEAIARLDEATRAAEVSKLELDAKFQSVVIPTTTWETISLIGDMI
jgi:RNA-splicing ligase RtcB